MLNKFSESGYIIVRKAISSKLISLIQKEIYNKLGIFSTNKKKNYIKFCNIVKKNKSKEYFFTKPLFEILLYKGLLKKLFLEKKFHSAISEILGKDLAFCTDPGITLNLPDKPDPKKNYLYKDWHQEIWSGASPSTIQIWTPLIHKTSKSGQIELIKESHKWGHVPHRDRKPLELPKFFKTIKLNLNYGDVIIFSTLLLHRSLPTNSARLSFPCLLKNFKFKDNSFQDIRSFHNYSYSEITKIERILGNHFLSPFRLKNLDDNNLK